MEQLIKELVNLSSIHDDYRNHGNQDDGYFESDNFNKKYVNFIRKNPLINAIDFQKGIPYFEFFRGQAKDIIDNILSLLPSIILIQDTAEQITLIEKVSSFLEFSKDDLKKDSKENKLFEIFLLQIDVIFEKLFRIRDKYLITEKQKNKNFAIQWNGGVRTLGYLFYELVSQQKYSNGDFYISNPKQDLLLFVHSNFVDKDGKSFDNSSLRKAMYPAAEKDKPAKAKVNINKLKEI